jgi:hypothetical protein
VLYDRAEVLLEVATTDTSGKVALKVKMALGGKLATVKNRARPFPSKIV